MSLAFPKPEPRVRVPKRIRRRVTLGAKRAAVKAKGTSVRSKLIATADRLCGALVKKLAGGRCEAAGYDGIACSRGLDWAHGERRRYHQVRWARRNTWAICRNHHNYFEKSFTAWAAFRRERLGNPGFAMVGILALYGPKVDIPAVIAGLRKGQFIQGER